VATAFLSLLRSSGSACGVGGSAEGAWCRRLPEVHSDSHSPMWPAASVQPGVPHLRTPSSASALFSIFRSRAEFLDAGVAELDGARAVLLRLFAETGDIDVAMMKLVEDLCVVRGAETLSCSASTREHPRRSRSLISFVVVLFAEGKSSMGLP
jgi:hypothetical protein